jgi:hypothetical protein
MPWLTSTAPAVDLAFRHHADRQVPGAVPITKDNLTTVVDAGWISKEDLCQGVSENGPAPCN